MPAMRNKAITIQTRKKPKGAWSASGEILADFLGATARRCCSVRSGCICGDRAAGRPLRFEGVAGISAEKKCANDVHTAASPFKEKRICDRLAPTVTRVVHINEQNPRVQPGTSPMMMLLPPTLQQQSCIERKAGDLPPVEMTSRFRRSLWWPSCGLQQAGTLRRIWALNAQAQWAIGWVCHPVMGVS